MAPLATAALLLLLLLAGGGAPGQRGGRRVKYADGLLVVRNVSIEGLGGGEAVQTVAQLQRERPRKAEVSVGIETGVVVNRIRDEFVSFNMDSTFDRGFFSRNVDNPHLVYLAKQLTKESPAFLRLGGSGGNEMSYGVGNITCEQQAAARDYRCPFPGNYTAAPPGFCRV